LEANFNIRNQENSTNTAFSSLGLRWNMFRREYDY